jgi:hypothetical protein
MLSCEVTYFGWTYSTVSVEHNPIRFEVLAMDIGTADFLKVLPYSLVGTLHQTIILLSFQHSTEAHPSARSLGEPLYLKLSGILSLKSEYYYVP